MRWRVIGVESITLELFAPGNNRLIANESLPTTGAVQLIAPPSGSARIVLTGIVLVRPNGFEAIRTRAIVREILIIV